MNSKTPNSDGLRSVSDAVDLPPLPEGCRHLAWNGVSFAVPRNWELAVFRFLRRGASRIELEDEYTLRMEAEWVPGNRRELDVRSILERYEKASKPLTLKAEEEREIAELPEGWKATRFDFRETGDLRGKGRLDVVAHGLVTAFYLCPQKSLFAFFLLHFMPKDPEDPAELVRRLAGSFRNHVLQDSVPWRLFDLSFALPRAFKLEKTDFDIGRKMMRFEWRRRVFCLWHFSCADMFLKEGVTAERWAAGFLNHHGGFKGLHFGPDGRGGIRWRRKKPYVFGHWTEIARWSFRYHIAWRRDEAANQLVLWIFQYRRPADLQRLPADFR